MSCAGEWTKHTAMNPRRQPSTKASWRDSKEGCEARGRQLALKTSWLWWPGRRPQLASDWIALGAVCHYRGMASLAETSFQRALQLLPPRRITRFKRSLQRNSLIAGAHNFLGILELAKGDADRAAREIDKAIAIRRELLRLFPKDRENQVYLGGALCDRGGACASSDASTAAHSYEECLHLIRQPKQTCACGYWDAERESWWCSQLEAIGDALGLRWVGQAPRFVDQAMQGLAALKRPQ